MTGQRKLSIPELLDLADRMIGYGNKPSLDEGVRKDCVSSGMVLANLLLKDAIAEALVLGDTDSPPISPDKPSYAASIGFGRQGATTSTWCDGMATPGTT
jgi:hypothetical protein